MTNSRKKKTVANEKPPVLEYLAEFKALIDACGQISYFNNMRDFKAAGVLKASIVASAYSHPYAYYDDQSREWGVKASRSYAVLKYQAEKLGFEIPAEDDLLKMLTYKKDRREAYTGYLNTCLKNDKAWSPAELEEKFQNRLKKRMKKDAEKNA